MKKKMIAMIVACSMAVTCMPGMALADDAVPEADPGAAEEQMIPEDEALPEEITAAPETEAELDMDVEPEMEAEPETIAEPEMKAEAPATEQDAAVTDPQEKTTVSLAFS